MEAALFLQNQEVRIPSPDNEDKGQFKDADGTTFTRADFNDLAKLGFGRAAQAGDSTLARNAVWQSLIRGEGSDAPRLLGAFVQLLRTHDPRGLDSPVRHFMYARRFVRDS